MRFSPSTLLSLFGLISCALAAPVSGDAVAVLPRGGDVEATQSSVEASPANEKRGGSWQHCKYRDPSNGRWMGCVWVEDGQQDNGGYWNDNNEWVPPAGCEGAMCNSHEWWGTIGSSLGKK
ncbi:MAG: hypothetical protein M1832_005955 [Thelocarpon impressellum]|nr:MAG: hypothetical protein M1832_005955 [Thelocarpon impressellum]